MPVINTRVRQAGPQDAVGCLTIYRPYVENTAVSWELDVPTVDEMAERITAACQMHAWLVLESDGPTIGVSYGHASNRLPSYQWSVETGLYVADDHHRRGEGRKLYTQLLNRLGERGYRPAVARITH